MRQRYCKECGGWHELDKWPVQCWEKRNSIRPKRADFGFPMINTSDSQEPLLSHADGKTYTSKALMRASYRAENNPQGVNYVELGPEPYRAPKPKADKEGIRTAIKQARDLHNL